MIKQSNKAFAKKVFGKFFFTVAILAAATMSKAQAIESLDTGDNNVAIRYLGEADNMNLFDVYYKNVEGEKFILSIKDDNGNVLFKSSFSGQGFDRKFKVEKDLDGKLYFAITGVKDNSTQTYEVNTTVRELASVEIREVK